jgi:hypothetical protein
MMSGRSIAPAGCSNERRERNAKMRTVAAVVVRHFEVITTRD